MMSSHLKTKSLLTVAAAASLAAVTLPASAAGFGIFEPKTLALGGAGVAIADAGNATFYNPALLANYDYDEDKPGNGRLYFPASSLSVSDSIFDAQDIEDDELVDQISSAVSDFNTTQSAQNAQTVVDSIGRLNSSLTDLQDARVNADGFVGLVISEPGDGQGGAFYVGGRAYGSGLLNITDTDLGLLDDYAEGLDFIASNGSRGQAHPELFDATGNLIDPRDDLTSTATALGVASMEVGVSFAQRFTVWGQDIALGATPKFSVFYTSEAFLDLQNNNVVTATAEQSQRQLNLDLGFATQFGNWQLGLAVKDVFEQSLDTDLGNTIDIGVKPRLGLGYSNNRWLVGLDVDVIPIDTVGNNIKTQDLSFGVQWRAFRQTYLRSGLRQDINNSENSETVISLGLGTRWRSCLLDIAVAQSSDSQSAALQIGWVL